MTTLDPVMDSLPLNSIKTIGRIEFSGDLVSCPLSEFGSYRETQNIENIYRTLSMTLFNLFKDNTKGNYYTKISR